MLRSNEPPLLNTAGGHYKSDGVGGRGVGRNGFLHSTIALSTISIRVGKFSMSTELVEAALNELEKRHDPN